jgi:uncharacterized membrane protein
MLPIKHVSKKAHFPSSHLLLSQYHPPMSYPTPVASTLKFLLGWALCFLFRALPLPPNVEPLMATSMPFSRHYGPFGAFVFAFLSIVLFDVFSQMVGQWTLITAITYGIIGMGAHYALRHRADRPLPYMMYAVVATLVYDLITGVIMGPVLFGGSFREAFIGQIPFTINHLLGNIVLSALLSPLISRWVVRSERLEGIGKIALSRP